VKPVLAGQFVVGVILFKLL